MTMNIPLLAEFKHETATTRKMLELVPMDKADWKPHEKSSRLGPLANHIADMLTWTGVTLQKDGIDFATDFVPKTPKTTTADLLDYFDKNVADGIAVLEATTDDQLSEMWTMRNGEQVYFTMPKSVTLRQFVFSHIVHHRAQLGVYLRLLDVPLPSTYGPTADNPMM
ncbi:MAG: DinB family protein [Bacteroidota bacterium]